MNIRRWWKNTKERLLPRRQVVITEAETLPPKLPRRNFVLTKDDGEVWSIGLRCPCGRGVPIELPLVPEARPRWRLTLDAPKHASLSPSV